MRFFLLLFILSNPLSSQKLSGKWVLINPENTYVEPECIVLEFVENSTIKTYNFDEFYKKETVLIDTVKKCISDNYKVYEYRFVDKNRMNQYFKYKGFDDISIWHFIRLLPTTINMPVSNVLSQQYDNSLEKNIFNATKTLEFMNKEYNKKIIDTTSIANYSNYGLENIDDTYFVVKYGMNKKREWVLPIKEINKNNIVIYHPEMLESPIILNVIKKIEWDIMPFEE